MCTCPGVPIMYNDPEDPTSFVYACPCGTVWNQFCCECEPCYDQGQCGEGTFFNPTTCQCACLPECCDLPGQMWDFNTCSCVGGTEPICTDTKRLCHYMNAFPGSLEWEFAPLTCAIAQDIDTNQPALQLTCAVFGLDNSSEGSCTCE